MKKNVLGWDLLLFICGIALVIISPNSPIIFGMGCGFIGAAIVTLYKYVYRLNPKNKIIYEEHLKNEKINLTDERKIMLREKSGRITYIIMFVVLTILNIIFTFIGVDKWIINTLWGVIAFKYICGVVVFYYLSKKM
ncbi:hypothetical protein KTC96_22730 (plasmid) [Clostridium estertheticum]|uniref:hypothetical protein n=1 Tax=Clostridium estertheticum TaxID=238834 RepID=UPI001C7E0CC0|nr:hypothetical protein [Clostridium estertheticum]MBX4260387.1 hypothetical protein [Clostridium estertheticum]WLC73031.1 hypothetical protein KTC96_22730 [Clostridium estertheticum]